MGVPVKARISRLLCLKSDALTTRLALASSEGVLRDSWRAWRIPKNKLHARPGLERALHWVGRKLERAHVPRPPPMSPAAKVPDWETCISQMLALTAIMNIFIAPFVVFQMPFLVKENATLRVCISLFLMKPLGFSIASDCYESQIAPCKVIWNPEYRIQPLESRIHVLELRIQRLESKIPLRMNRELLSFAEILFRNHHRSRIRIPEPGIRNPESNTVLDYRTWGRHSRQTYYTVAKVISDVIASPLPLFD